jgi:MoaA/NifB/PqqE/SkfB family radical SAM enzyme
MLGADLEEHIEKAERFIAVRDELAKSNYCSVTMQLTFMRQNLHEIPDMVRLAASMGFDRVKGHQLWAHFPELDAQSLRNDIVYATQWNRVVDECQAIVAEQEKLGGHAPRLDNFFKLDLANLEDIAPDGECPFLNKEIWVDPTGRFNVCCAPDQQRKSLGDFGNLMDTSVEEVINGDAYADLVRNYRSLDLCKGCNMRRPS